MLQFPPIAAVAMQGHVPPPLPGAGSSGLGVSLLFLQTVRTTERIYQRFGSLEEAMEAVLQIFEAHLEARIRQDEQWAPPSFRALMPDARPSRTATYKLADVCHFLDKFGDIFIMVGHIKELLNV